MAYRFCSALRTFSKNPRIFLHQQKLFLSPVTLARTMVSNLNFRIANAANARNQQYYSWLFSSAIFSDHMGSHMIDCWWKFVRIRTPDPDCLLVRAKKVDSIRKLIWKTKSNLWKSASKFYTLQSPMSGFLLDSIWNKVAKCLHYLWTVLLLISRKQRLGIKTYS